MTIVSTEAPLKAFEARLASQVDSPERRGDFDMNDGPEAELLAKFPDLDAALSWLNSNLVERWRIADNEALTCRRHHEQLARVAIATGTLAIVLAVVQLSIKLTMPSLTAVALALEGGAMAAAVIAVALGLRAKFDHRWLGQRHLAERLRMLKFRSLVQLWCFDFQAWQAAVAEQVTFLANAGNLEEIDRWLNEELIVLDDPESLKCEPPADLVNALTLYYRFKRVEFQASYFNRRREDFRKGTGRWLHLSLPLFLSSVVCVIAHFLLETLAGPVARSGNAAWAGYLEDGAVWFVALAAIIPVLGLGVRAWFAALELPRSANLFAAKHRALSQLTNQLQQDAGKVLPTLRHMTQAELFLEQEHREWLRLLLDTEWFL